jgi:AraC-like DNA-binding protein
MHSKNTMQPEAHQLLVDALTHLLPEAGQIEIMPGVIASRRHHPTALTPTIYTPALCLLAQGSKIFYVNQKSYMYDETHVMLFSINMPIVAQIVRATATEPLLGLRINLQPAMIATVVQKCFPTGIVSQTPTHGIMVHPTTNDIIDAARRLITLERTSASDTHIWPLIMEELLIRLLYSPIGHHLAHIGNPDTGMRHMTTAIDWIRQHFHEPLHIRELADRTHLSASAFHVHFKALTGMTPLHYQKSLRLHEARRLLHTTTLDVGEIGRHVGYQSASQFSREYRRLFGVAPSQSKPGMRPNTPS